MANALPSHLENAQDEIVIAGPHLFGAKEKGEAHTSSIALRNWLDEGKSRRAILMIKANAANSKQVTGVDREIAMRLNEFVKSGQLKVKVVADDILSRAPRLSLRIGNEVQEFYGDADGPPLMEGAMSGVSHQISVKASESWWQSISGHASDIPNPISSLTEKILSFRFHPHQTRKFAPMFEPIVGRVVSIRLEDPYCAASQRNRERLALFFREIVRAGVQIKEAEIVWKLDKQKNESEKIDTTHNKRTKNKKSPVRHW